MQPIALWGGCSHWLLGLKLQRRESLDFLGTSFIPVSLSPAADSAGSAPEPRLGMQWLPPLLSSWHPCMAYGTPAWHMAALLSSWHICTVLAHLHGAGTCAWHLPLLPSSWQDPAATTVTGREREGGGGCSLFPIPRPPSWALPRSEPSTSSHLLPFPHLVSFLGENYVIGSRADTEGCPVPRLAPSFVTSPGPLGTSHPPLGPGDLEVALLFGSAAVRRLNSAPVLGI